MTQRTTKAIDLAYKAHGICRILGDLFVHGECRYRDRRVRIASHVKSQHVVVYERRFFGLSEHLVLDVRIRPGNWDVRYFRDGRWADYIDRYVLPEAERREYLERAGTLAFNVVTA